MAGPDITCQSIYYESTNENSKFHPAHTDYTHTAAIYTTYLDHLGGKVIGRVGLLTGSYDRADGVTLIEETNVLLLFFVPDRCAQNVVGPKRFGGVDGLGLGRQFDDAMISGCAAGLEIGGSCIGQDG